MSVSMFIILLILCCITLIVSIVSVVIGIKGLKQEEELVKLYRVQATNQQAVVRTEAYPVVQNNQATNNQGMVICRKCYMPIQDNYAVCPHCQTGVDRR